MLKRSVESLVGGCVVYAAMAACSGGGATGAPSLRNHSGAAMVAAEGGQSSTGGTAAQSTVGEFAGSAGGPVPDAMAAAGSGGAAACPCEPVTPVEPTIIEAKCETQFSGSPLVWAVANVPGGQLFDLARSVALIEYSTAASAANKLPEGFQSYAVGVYVKDGAIAASCGPVSTPGLQAMRVRFVLP